MDKTIVTGHGEVIRTGRTRDDYRGGKIHPVDPAAVARLRKIVAEQEARRTQPRQKVSVVTALLARQREREAAGENSMITADLDYKDAARLHVEHYQKGESAQQCADRAGVSLNTVLNRWRKLGAPTSRKIKARAWTPPADDELEPKPAVTATEAQALKAEKAKEAPAPVKVAKPQPPAQGQNGHGKVVPATRQVTAVTVRDLAELGALIRSGAVSGIISVTIEAQLDIAIGGDE